MKPVLIANEACALANETTRDAIQAAAQAVVDMEAMIQDPTFPAPCKKFAKKHRKLLKHHRDTMRAMLAARQPTCEKLTECLDDNGIIVPQDGGGK
jgi:predicted outer membrane protein